MNGSVRKHHRKLIVADFLKNAIRNLGGFMKILIIRHGDPDYSIDSLTEKGWKEAEYLSEKLCKLDIKDIYVSPLGRAKDTASCTLKKLNRTAVECEWLREFNPTIIRPDRPEERCGVTWDWLPQDWTMIDNWKLIYLGE